MGESILAKHLRARDAPAPRAALGAYLANNIIPPALHADYVGIEVDVIPAHAHHRAMTCTLKEARRR